jgi:type I restriction enzyme S subunit
MFPQEGETVPKRRFKGFEEEWESVELSSLTEYANGMGHERLVVSNGKYELVNLNSISIEGIFKTSGKYVDESSKLLERNDLVMILSDVGHGDLLGRVALIPENKKYVLNQRVASLKPNELVDPLFLYFNINKNQKYFKYKGAGMSQLNISKEIVEELIVYMPGKEEQQKIGEFFKNLDNQIEMKEKKLDKLQKMKEAYLEEMFV